MSDKRFDRILQEKLKGHQVTLGEPNWAGMEKMLKDADEIASIDREVRNRLQNHTVEYKESHWQILKNKLELEKRLKEKIYLSKIAEFSILALLFFSVLHFNGQNEFISKKSSAVKQFVTKHKNTQHAKATHVQAINMNTEASSIVNEDLSSSQIDIDIQKQTISKQVDRQAPSTRAKTSDQTETATQFTQTTQTAQLLDNAEQIEIHNQADSHSTFGPLTPEAKTETQPVSDQADRSSDEAELNQNEPSTKTTVSAEQDQRKHVIMANLDKPTNQILVDALANITYGKASKPALFPSMSPSLKSSERLTEDEHQTARHILINSLESTASAPLAKINYASFPKKNEKWIGAMTGVDINLIRRPVDINKIDDPQNFAVVSLTSGANYSVIRGRNEFFTGVGYSRKFYDPSLIELVEISSSFYSREYTLEKYDIVHLPAQYKRHLANSNKLHAYVFGGVSMNFVIYTDYQQQDNLKRGQPRSKQILDLKASYNDTGFSGLLEGGYYKDNIYFTADAGFGIEKQINRVKFFFESQYKRQLFSSQLGPRRVKLNSLSFNIGTKYKI